MSWFNVLLATRKRLNDADDFKNICDVTDKLDDNANKDKRLDIITTYLAENHILVKGDSDKKMQAYILNENNIASDTNDAVENVYNEISNIDLNEDNSKSYENILSRIISSNGLFLNKDKRNTKEQPKKLEETAIKTLIDSFNTLKSSAHTVRNICTFIYQNNLLKVLYKNITDSEQPNIFEDIIITPYIIKQISDTKGNINIFKLDIYMVFSILAESEASSKLRDNNTFDTDEDFITALSSTNFGKYIPNLLYNTEKVNSILESIHKTYKNDDVICLNVLKNRLTDEKWVESNAKDITNFYKKKHSIATVIDDVNNYLNGETADVADENNIDDILKALDEALSTLLNGYYSLLLNIDKTITECNNMLTERVLINDNTIELSLQDCIKRWKDFIASPIYEWNAGKFLGECVDKCDDMVTKNKGKYNPVVDINKPKSRPQLFIIDKGDKHSILRATNVLRSIDITNSATIYHSIIPFIKATEYADEDNTQIDSKIIISKTILQYIEDFFMIKFDEKTDMKMASILTNKYFDAICNIIYKNDEAVTESLNTREYENFIMFESFVLNEELDFKSYFDKLATHMLKVMKSKEPSAADYVAKYALYNPNEHIDDKHSDEQQAQNVNSVNYTQPLDNMNNAFKDYISTSTPAEVNNYILNNTK